MSSDQSLADIIIDATPEELEQIRRLTELRENLKKELDHLQKQKADVMGQLQELESKKKGSMQFIDYGLACLWDIKDDGFLQKEIYAIRNHFHGLTAQTYEDKLHRVLNDQTVYFEFGEQRPFEPLAITLPNFDLVVNPGLVRIAQLILGTSNEYFTDYASGTGTTPEMPGDGKLSAENWRVGLQTSGFADAIGTAIKLQARFPPFLNAAVITEGGVFDNGAINKGTMLFRTVYKSGARIEHQQNRDAYSLFQNIVMLSVS